MKNLTKTNNRTKTAFPGRKWISMILLASLLPTSACAGGPGDSKIVAHPSKLAFPQLTFTPPKAAGARSVLSNGTPVYVVEDPSLPLVDLQVMVRTGAYLEPAGKEGVAGAVGSQMRAAGVEGRSPEDFDEEVAFLAAEMSTSIGDTMGSARFNCLAKDLDQVMGMFFLMLQKPAFDEKRLEIYRSQVLQNLARRNDSTTSIESREWTRLLRGPTHFTNDKVTKAAVEGMTRADLVAFHGKHFHPGNFILAVSGDVKRKQVIALLEKHLAGWKAAPGEPGKIPAPGAPAKPGVYMVDKPDVNQGRVGIGHIGVQRDHPDYFALRVMNQILGGGGFASRIMSRVRSDEGLAYTARSSYDFGVYYPGVFRAYFQSKSESVAHAATLVLEEIEKIRSEPVTSEELNTARNYMVEVFPRFFASASQVAGTFAREEFTGRSDDFFSTYRENIRGVTAEKILQVAKKHLTPDKTIILVVGNSKDILAGDPDKPQFSIRKLAGEGKIENIPLADPLSLKRE